MIAYLLRRLIGAIPLLLGILTLIFFIINLAPGDPTARDFNPNVAPDPLVAAWGTFQPSPLNVAQAGELQAAAVRLMDRAGFR